jgi:acetoacetate decarboxylase
MYVNNDINLYRGLIQGLPKQQASLWMTRSYPVQNPAGAPLRAGTRLGATMNFRDRRLVEATLTLEEAGAEPLGLASSPVLGIRYFPDLAGGGALAHDIVAFTGSGKVVADVWAGTPTLSFFPSPNQELADLSPVRIGRGTRYAMGFTITDIRKVAEASR